MRPDIWKKGWSTLQANDRKNFLLLLVVIVVSALSSATMVVSVLPFLSVLSEPDRIEEIRILAWAYDWFEFTSTYRFLVAVGIASFSIMLVSILIQIASTYFVKKFATMQMHTLSHRLLGQYLRQPYEFFLNRHSDDMATTILSETREYVRQFLEPATILISSFLTICAILAVLIFVSPLIAVFSALTIMAAYGASYYLSYSLVRRFGKERSKANKERFRIVSEALSGIKDVKILDLERSYKDKFFEPSLRMAKGSILVTLISQLPRQIIYLVAFGGIFLVCIIAVNPTDLDNGMTSGNLIPILGVFALAGQRMLPEFSKFYSALTSLNYGAAAVENIYADLMETEARSDFDEQTPAPLGLKRTFELKGVSFKYATSKHVGLADISLEIKAGERIGIVGRTGAGKTTLADIFLGLLKPISGEIIVDGVRLDDCNRRSWIRSVGYVPQDIYLIDASVAENIAFGLSTNEVDQERIERCASIAQLDEFVRTELPRSYQTKIGDRGVRLSGGQRQRIGIARALYRDSAVIVFDEATSALDNMTELEVMNSIDALPGEKTVILIAHRLTTVRSCDRIIFIEAGRIVGFGAWDDLALENSAFKRLIEA